MEALAAVAREPHAEFTLEPITIEGPRAGEVLVEIEAVGICHTDLAARDGALPTALPAVLGHEGCGIVREVGPDVTKVTPGDRVAITFNSCGTCPSCSTGAPSYCHQFMHLAYDGVRDDGTGPLSTPDGERLTGLFFGQSSFATYSLAFERNVVKVPDDVPAELLAPLGCGIQTGAGAVMRSLNCRPRSALLVAGAGSVGLAASWAPSCRAAPLSSPSNPTGPGATSPSNSALPTSSIRLPAHLPSRSGPSSRPVSTTRSIPPVSPP